MDFKIAMGIDMDIDVDSLVSLESGDLHQQGCSGPLSEVDMEDGEICNATPAPVSSALVSPNSIKLANLPIASRSYLSFSNNAVSNLNAAASSSTVKSTDLPIVTQSYSSLNGFNNMALSSRMDTSMRNSKPVQTKPAASTLNTTNAYTSMTTAASGSKLALVSISTTPASVPLAARPPFQPHTIHHCPGSKALTEEVSCAVKAPSYSTISPVNSGSLSTVHTQNNDVQMSFNSDYFMTPMKPGKKSVTFSLSVKNKLVLSKEKEKEKSAELLSLFMMMDIKGKRKEAISDTSLFSSLLNKPSTSPKCSIIQAADGPRSTFVHQSATAGLDLLVDVVVAPCVSLHLADEMGLYLLASVTNTQTMAASQGNVGPHFFSNDPPTPQKEIDFEFPINISILQKTNPKIASIPVPQNTGFDLDSMALSMPVASDLLHNSSLEPSANITSVASISQPPPMSSSTDAVTSIASHEYVQNIQQHLDSREKLGDLHRAAWQTGMQEVHNLKNISYSAFEYDNIQFSTYNASMSNANQHPLWISYDQTEGGSIIMHATFAR
ncbi:hypothetical protein BDQ12DRAFT_663631 [Crucibulum laeve]|uniref:Uncharacterized protein n=1 Tax=Crucibulum laeve TaxID=68775 RepID=A0A5C3M8B3_9AGAR|nr:hypothetical protein BDQ12DRAFT_663631 [Crucibulum laeve]